MKAAARSRAETSDSPGEPQGRPRGRPRGQRGHGLRERRALHVGWPAVTFLARGRDKAEQGLKAAVQSVRSSTVADRVDTGDYEKDFDAARARRPTSIFEALTEDFDSSARCSSASTGCGDPTQSWPRSRAACRSTRSQRGAAIRSGSTSSACTSSIRRTSSSGPSSSPGRTPTRSSSSSIEAYAQKMLGRVMIRTADTPGFAGNRIGFKVLNEAAQLAEEHGPVLVERLVGPYTGRALTPLATVDLVGWDIHRAIVDNIHRHAPDEAHATLASARATWRACSSEGCSATRAAAASSRSTARSSSCSTRRPSRTGPSPRSSCRTWGSSTEVAKLHRDGRYREAMKASSRRPARGPRSRARSSPDTSATRSTARARSPRASRASTTSWASASTGRRRASSST